MAQLYNRQEFDDLVEQIANGREEIERLKKRIDIVENPRLIPNGYVLNKISFGISLVALVGCIVMICIVYPHVYDNNTIEFDYWGFIIGVFGVLTTILLGIQVVQSVKFEKEVDRFYEKINAKHQEFTDDVDVSYKKYVNKMNRRIGEIFSKINNEYKQKTIEIKNIESQVSDDYEKVKEIKKDVQRVESVTKQIKTSVSSMQENVAHYQENIEQIQNQLDLNYKNIMFVSSRISGSLTSLYHDMYDIVTSEEPSSFAARYAFLCIRWGADASCASYMTGNYEMCTSAMKMTGVALDKFKKLSFNLVELNTIKSLISKIEKNDELPYYDDFMNKFNNLITMVENSTNDNSESLND